MKRWWITLLLAAVGVVVSLCSCGGDEVTAAPPGADAGVEAAPSETSTAARESLGGRCRSDDECLDGLVCFNKGDGEYWPANGLCSKRCADEAACAAVQAGAKCFGFGTPDKWCFEACTTGPHDLPAINSGPLPGKCHGRPDVACSSRSGCRPSCADDTGCEGGKCDPKVSGCTAGPIASWDDIGNAKPNPCSTDFVTSGTSDVSVCTAHCVLGVVPSCGWSGPGTRAKAACLLITPEAGRGDQSLCTRVCDTDCDCEGGRLCAPFDPKFKADTGRNGVCSVNPTSNLPCGDAGADAGDSG